MTAAPDLVLTADGPLLVRGPAVVELPDGRRVHLDRPVSALCLCRRTRRPPFCDTSHRRRVRHAEEAGDA
jgi:CDGSH-type Zn-finger protein